MATFEMTNGQESGFIPNVGEIVNGRFEGPDDLQGATFRKVTPPTQPAQQLPATPPTPAPVVPPVSTPPATSAPAPTAPVPAQNANPMENK